MLTMAMTWQAHVQRRFDRAASRYDAWAGAQQSCVDELLAWLAGDIRCAGCWLDLGAGTGQLGRRLLSLPDMETVLALDLSPGMLGMAMRGNAGVAILPVCADALALPLASHALDGVASSFALHWTCDPPRALNEIVRILKPAAPACLAIPVLGSLPGRPADTTQGSALQPLADWREAAMACAVIEKERVVTYADHYPQPDDWLDAVRAMGITARHAGPAGLGGRQRLAELRDGLEAVREPAGIPLRYTVWQVRLRAPASPNQTG